MQGTLTGVVLNATTTDTQTTVKLAGITDNGHRGVTWIHTVTFTGSRKLATLPAEGSVARVTCMATQQVFQGRDGQKASTVALLGVTLTPHAGPITRKGSTPFLLQSVNEFRFAAFLTRDPVRKPVGVTEARVGVRDRKGHTHYFNCEAWRTLAPTLGARHAAAELTLTCILRRDRVDTAAGARAFDVMEVIALTAQGVANAAD